MISASYSSAIFPSVLGHGFLFFDLTCPIALVPFVEKTLFIPLNYFCPFVKNHFDIFVWVCLRVLSYFPLISVCSFSNTTLS